MSDDLRLVPSTASQRRPGPVLLVVMDGVGVGPGDGGDAVALARTPTLDRLAAEGPFLNLKAHGTAVGLPVRPRLIMSISSGLSAAPNCPIPR